MKVRIKYTPVTSSNIIGYHHKAEEKKLYILFTNGREYEYSDVTKEEVEELNNAESFGSKLREIIIPHKKTVEI